VPQAAVRGIRLYYEVAGGGPPVLFISGTGSDPRTTPGPFDSQDRAAWPRITSFLVD
jgi:3-oxoadipate enol-lactonase